MDINIDENGIHVSKSQIKKIDDDRRKKKKYQLIESVRTSSFTGLALVLYIVLSLTLSKTAFPSGYSSWAIFWPIIFLAFVPSGIRHAIVTHRFNLFPIWAIALFTYLFIGCYLGVWHPYWVIRLSIPAYYAIFSPLDKIIIAKETGEID